MKRLLLPLLLLWAPALWAEATFSGLNLSSQNQLLFQAQVDAPGFDHYRTLFQADLQKKSITQLTFFPERVVLLRSENELQVQNRFGVFRTDANLQNMAPVGIFPGFVWGQDIQTGKINPTTSSPDGRYLLYLKPVTFGHADLMMYRVADRSTLLVSSNVEMSLDGPAAVWSPDSQYFVYTKADRLYYYSIDQLRQSRLLDESLRSIGTGTIANVQWNDDGSLYYVSGSLVYQIQSTELFTRSLYTDLLKIGRIVGKIPFNFDPNFDEFWVSPDGQSILLGKDGRNIFLYYLHGDDYATTGGSTNLPYLLLPRNTSVEKVLWGAGGLITLLTGSIVDGANQTALYRLNLLDDSGSPVFAQTNDAGVTGIALSPDGSQVALLKGNSVVIRSYADWKDAASFSEPSPLDVIWLSNHEIIVAGRQFIEYVDVASKDMKLIALSQPGDYGFSASNGAVLVRTNGRIFSRATSSDTSVQWQATDSYDAGGAQVASNDYRVYVDETPTASYANMVMVRNIQGLGTQPLFPYPKVRYEAFPAKEEPVDFSNFTHGSRIRRREVALVFNAIDTVEGLTAVLNTLREYNLRCTFFVNGEFIRRNPDAVKEIADSGQEVGSLFYAYFNMTDSRYRVDSSFIQQGLGRNEDDYFAATGKELTLLWHAPYYFTNNSIIQAAQAMNYTYVGSDVDPLDWVTEEDGLRGANIYLSAADIVDRTIAMKKPGSIIPIRIGVTGGQRADYLFNKLDLLINGLISLGYSIVPVSTLVEHAR